MGEVNLSSCGYTDQSKHSRNLEHSHVMTWIFMPIMQSNEHDRKVLLTDPALSKQDFHCFQHGECMHPFGLPDLISPDYLMT